jgi:ABC-type multidrug transport system fused ATPase/permease subunit
VQPDRAHTRVAPQGIPLTQSQEQRISLARAVYAMLVGQADILLMDDPVSAVDPLGPPPRREAVKQAGVRV